MIDIIIYLTYTVKKTPEYINVLRLELMGKEGER